MPDGGYTKGLVNQSRFSRRALLLSSAATLGCGRPPKATGYGGYCVVANQESRSVALIDLSNFRRIRILPLDAAPSLVLAHSTRPKAFVLAPAAGTLYELDAASLSVSRRLRLGQEVASMKLAGDTIWVLTRNPATLTEIPVDSLKPRRRIRLGAVGDTFDLSRDNRAVVGSRQANAITLVSLEHSAIEGAIATPAEPTNVCFQSDGKQVLSVSGPDRSLTIYDAASRKTVVRLPLPFAPRRYCFNSDGGQLFLTGDGMDAVVIVYPYQTEVAETVLAGRAPDAMATTAATAPAGASAVPGPYLLVANPPANTVTVLNIDDRRLVSVVEVGQAPREILITPDNQYALVLNEGSGEVAVIRLYSLENPSRAHRYKSASVFTLIPVGARPVSAAVVQV